MSRETTAMRVSVARRALFTVRPVSLMRLVRQALSEYLSA